MKQKLELKDICGYLPYDLKYYNNKPNQIGYGIVFDCKPRNAEFYIANQDMCAPILYPLSVLYEPMPDGTIPILECANLTSKGDFELVPESNYTRSKCGTYEFGYFKGEFWLNDTTDDRKLHINQIPMFDYLNFLKIDYRGLIDKGLAVSVYDLEINPYK